MRVAVLIVVLLTGCDSGDGIKAAKGVVDQCRSKVRAELRISQWNNSFTVICDDFVLKDQQR